MVDGTCILIVDDDRGMAETLSDILEEMGYRTSVTFDGSSAIGMVKGGSFHLVIMDIKMPGLNGVEALKVIKRMQPAMKVVMITAYSSDDLVAEALREGASMVLHKPLNIEKLIDVIPEECACRV